VNIQCPNCGHGLNLKEVKPGKYKPKCNKCEQRFFLVLPADGSTPTIQRLESEGTVANAQSSSSVQSTPVVDATLPHNTTNRTIVNKEAGSGFSNKSPVDNTATPANDPKPQPALPQVDKSQKTRVGNAGGTLHPHEASSNVNVSAGTGYEFASPEESRKINQATNMEADATTLDLRPKKNTIPEVLGGYKLVKELGRGAMGAVYLAKQLSLDRNVALKLIQAKWASNPVFVARFTREAYAAAQLTHHNVVQIYDLGSQGDINFYTMEYVQGQSLAQLVQREGKLDAEAAVGYILQAARGLHFAHMQGMVHRDVKPANLMLNEQGVVKVADLGLVKTPHLVEEQSPDATIALGNGPNGHGSSLSAATAEVTMANIAMGTPAYMAPEQATNAAGVDHRADIYSLGCTMYVLLTGRPPFEGASALEVITKHKTEAIIRPEAIVKRIPPELSNIVLKMVAKRPDDRYQNLTEVIKTLEDFLGIQSSGPFSPREEHAQTLEDSLNLFNNAPLAKLRNLVSMGFTAGCVGLAVVFLLLGQLWLVMAMGVTAVGAVVCYLAFSGTFDQNIVYEKIRNYVFNFRLSDWFTYILTAGMGLFVIYLLGSYIWGGILLGAICGAICGAAYYFVIDKRLAASRKESLKAMEALLKTLRLRGVEEAAIEQFVVKYSGEQWEEFYETLFGYDAKIRARNELLRSDQGRRRKQYGTWRDRIINSLDAKLKADREERDRKHLQKIEEANLKAQGVNPKEAREEAERMAQVQVDAAAEVRALPTDRTMTAPEGIDPKVIAAQKRSKQLQMLTEARGGKRKEYRENYFVKSLAGPVGFIFSPKMRFLLGVLFCGLFLQWLNINGILGALDEAASSIETAEEGQEVAATFFEKLKDIAINPTSDKLDALPFGSLGIWLSHVGTGIGGLILLVAGVFRGHRMSYFAWPAALVALFAQTCGIGLIGYAIAAGIAAVGLLIGRQLD
jgi:eukaryotic-like serine/threonine-protein kinase